MYIYLRDFCVFLVDTHVINCELVHKLSFEIDEVCFSTRIFVEYIILGACRTVLFIIVHIYF